jgi:hypothetical protein
MVALLAFMLCASHLMARPHVLAWPFLVVWMAAVVRARDAGRVPSFALIPLIIVWSNLHAGFIAGLGIAGLLGAEAVFEAAPAMRLRVIRAWGIFLGLAASSALISPNGLDQYLFTFKVLGMKFMMAHISEWQGVSFSRFQPLLIWLGLMILGGYTLRIRLPVYRIVLVLLLLYLALTHIRHLELLALMGPLLVAPPFAKQLGAAARTAITTPTLRSNANPAAVLGLVVAVAIAFLASAILLDRRGLQPPEITAPVDAVKAARAAGLTGNVLNSPRFGGYLEMLGIPVFIDGRADLFGDAFIKRFINAGRGVDDGIPGLIDDYSIQWAIFESDIPVITIFSYLSDWERIYADEYVVVFRRKP